MRKLLMLAITAALAVGLVVPAAVFAQDGKPSRLEARPLHADSVVQGDQKAEGGRLPPTGASAGGDYTSIIVKLDDASLASYGGGVLGLPATSPEATGAALDVNAPASRFYLAYLNAKIDGFQAAAAKAAPDARVTYRYDVVLGGVAMIVPTDRIGAIAGLPGVQAVYPDVILELDTENSPGFVGAPTTWNQLGGQENAGEGVIVGVLDTGIWPEHPSFSDPDPAGNAYPAPPAAPDGDRACEFSGGANPGDPFTCNNKLIGADRFMATYDALQTLLPGEFTTARDDNGHGTHTSSTSAGNAGVEASIFGVPRGTVSGIAPRAHVIMYKVCGDQGCYSTDSAAAVQEAIQDGVDVINFSISGGSNPYSDSVSLAFLDAYNAGVFVAASAGNSGPGADTVNHREPWVTTVAASTQNRAFTNQVIVNGGALTLDGVSLTAGVGPLPLVNAADPPYSNALCLVPAVPGTFTGKIVICQRGVNARVNKGFNVLQGGAAGMVLYNQSTAVTDQETDNHFLPASHIQFTQGQTLLAFLAANPGATATITAGSPTAAQGDVMASFSSRGGPGQSLGISKPDVTAPGVQILAGHSPESADPDTGPQGELFQAIAGTSMSSPHIAGAAALLSDLHPSWTPGQIRSALMTTAAFRDLVKEDGTTPFTPFDAGSGRLNLRKAWDPGLTFDETGANYVALQSELWNANYPSVYIPVMPGLVSVQRTAKEVSGFHSHYVLRVMYPAGQARDFRVKVPRELLIDANAEESFEIVIDARDVPMGEVRHATIVLTEKNFGCVVRIPVTIVRRMPVVALEKSCDPASLPRGDTTECRITITNNGLDDAPVSLIDRLPRQLRLVSGSVVGATEDGNGLTFEGTLAGAEPPNVSIAPDGSPAGFLPLSGFGVTPVPGVGDEAAVNFNVPAFTYAGQTYTRIAMVSNGYAVVGGATGSADIQYINQVLPNSARPNNVLAPFWTDLNPPAGAAGSGLRATVLTDGSDSWIVLEWQAVPEYSDGTPASFQIWIGVNGDANPGEDITFVYGSSGNGDRGLLTVGAENLFGNRGQNYYANGVGTLPTSTTQLRVTGTPPVPGESHVITFEATGHRVGAWTNYARMTSELFFGTNIARFSGEVTAPSP